MRIFLFFTFILFLSSCTTVEVAKEVTKATKSIKVSVDNIFKSMEEDKKVVEIEKTKSKQIVIEQKKITKIEFLEKPIDDIYLKLGNPDLYREDGDITLVRFDSDNCRLFMFYNSADNSKEIKHFEIRDAKGNLIIKKNKLDNCYKNFNLI